MDLLEYLQYGFIQRALLCGTFIALLCSTLGVILVLRRFSLIGDGLAHVTFGSVALGLLFRIYPLYISIPVVMLSSLGILKLTQRARLYGDAAIGIVSSFGIAGGVILASVAGGFNVDLFSYLFGNILAIGPEELYISITLSVVVLAVIFLYFNEIFSMTFDEEFAHVSGIGTERLNTILALLTAITVVLTMSVVGIMLVSALLILPAVTALQLARSFRGAMLIAACVSLIAVIGGIFLSLILNLPTGATIVMTGIVIFLAALTLRMLRQHRHTVHVTRP
ncbi:MAG TPA: metal ABC transporter permease [Syntrophales bacterium]